ncbi:MAG: hypothetical protein NZM25_08730 [Leptospiraceae bacterium]|nr:hypothetical protein [Leptospiraceae bacterium]MDW8306802.1 hypothetical protein [Leptospiraceae bacterium]
MRSFLLALGVFLTTSQAAEFLKTNFGARSVALGNAYGVIVNDPSALHWNPAGLANITGEKTTIRKLEDITREAESAFEEKEFSEFLEEKEKSQGPQSVARTERGFELQWYNAAAFLPMNGYTGFSGIGLTALGGTLGAAAYGALSQRIQAYDSAGNAVASRDFRALAAYLGYARQSGALRWGFSLMGLEEGMQRRRQGGGVHIGAQMIPIPILSAGIALQNLVGAVQKEASNNQKWEKLDTLLRFSFAITTPPPQANMKIIFGFTSNLDRRQEAVRMNLGLAYSLSQYLYLMFGLDHGNPATGLGIMVRPLHLAYAVNRDSVFGTLQHYVELNLTF